MAKLYPQPNSNTGRYVAYLAGAALCALMPLLALIAYNVTGERVCLYLAALFGICGVWLGVRWGKQAAVLRSGLAGEKAAARLLRTLPGEFSVLLNPVYVVNGRETELDALAVSPAGVFIIETKNHAGTLSGEPDAPFWRQTRSGKGGTMIEKQMKNPLLQNERQVRLLTQLLGENGVKCPVRGYVLFTNNFIDVQIKDKRLYKNGDTLVRALGRLKPKLAEEEVQAAVQLLRRAAQ